jgi:glycosyltransferase involved in cell wall biosynthesis
MHIGIDIRELEKVRFTGIGRVLRNFLTYISHYDPTNEYTLFANQHTAYTPTASNQKIITIKEGNTILWDQWILPRSIKRYKIDTFISFYHKAPYFTKAHTIVMIHDLIPLKVKEYQNPSTLLSRLYFKFILNMSLRYVNTILTNSHSTRNDLIDYTKTARTNIKPITLSCDSEYCETKAPENHLKELYGVNRKFILYVGNLKPHKNVSLLIDSYSHLPKNLQDEFLLVIVAEKTTHYDAIKSQITTLNLNANVIVTGSVPADHLPYLYSEATLFVFPSLYEGFGLPVLEAMACGTPVITSNTSSLPEVGGNAAVFIDPRNKEELTTAIEQILIDKVKYATMKEKGLTQAKYFSVERMGIEILTTLNEIV